MSAIDDFHSAILGMAEELGLEGDEAEEYVSFHMERKGYKRATTWETPDPQQGGGGQGGGLFSGGGQRKPASRQQQGGGRQQGGSYFGGKKTQGK